MATCLIAYIDNNKAAGILTSDNQILISYYAFFNIKFSEAAPHIKRVLSLW